MARCSVASRKKTRYKFQKPLEKKGKPLIRGFMQTFAKGEKVVMCLDPSYQKGMYFRRFHGRVGIIEQKKGKDYEVIINDAGKRKAIIVSPVHLKKV